MKKIFIFILFLFYNICVYSQNVEYNIWGIWDYEPYEKINENSPTRKLYSGRYYFSRGSDDWIGISQNSEGLVNVKYNYPLIGQGQKAEFVKLEKIEQIADGFILYLSGEGIKREGGKLEFKDNIKIILKMIFISENECKFQYYSKTDKDGFSLIAVIAKEDCIYRRFRVPTDNDIDK